MTPRLADRLEEARRGRFVGRAAEIALFQSALTARELPFNLLYVFGPGGVGKTTLLDEFVHLGQQVGISRISLDARYVDPSPDGFLAALGLAMGLSSGQAPLPVLASQSERRLILVDTYELLTPLDNWLREVFLPQLPEQTLIVLAGRQPPSVSWRTDPGWQNLIRIVPLRNLTPDESRLYLTRRQIPSDQHRGVLAFTHGHPLALALIADAFVQRGELQFHAEAAPDIVQTLVERFVQKVPGPAHRAALEACALVRLTTEAILAELLATAEVHELFDWLQSLSFIESGTQGLFPHDLAREALAVELRWRNPDWYAELHRRARNYYAARLSQTRGYDQQRVLFDYVYLHRDSPLMRPYLDWQETGTSMPDVLRPGDQDLLRAMVTRYEGAESAHWLDFWFTRQPQGTVVYRDAEGRPFGFLTIVALHEIGPEERTEDPATRVTWRYLEQHAPLRSGEKAILFRFWMARDTYQDVSATQSLIFGRAAQQYLTTPNLAFSFFATADPTFWTPMFTHVDLPRLADADFEIAGRRYGVFAHDWRVTPPLAWLTLLGEREIATEIETTPPPTVVTAVVLSEPEFAEAVRRALRHFTRAEALRQNPLLRSRLVIERVGDSTKTADRLHTLQEVLREAAASLQQSPREAKLYQVLHHTYFAPAPTQERAAELLDLPFSTYRRHLAAGINRIVELLWQWEVGGGEK
ncbi:MAG TPA: ATP-binding protein [Chloroflexota bacterium]|nr:ATP-binding protein [Chloroflexota bacterium]